MNNRFVIINKDSLVIYLYIIPYDKTEIYFNTNMITSLSTIKTTTYICQIEKHKTMLLK